MFGSIGVPEFAIALVILVSWLVPIAAAVWGVVTLHRLKIGQDGLFARLDAIERRLARERD